MASKEGLLYKALKIEVARERYLSPLLANVIKDEVESAEKNISEMLFKLAVEQAKLSHVIAAQSNIDDDSIL